MTLRCFIKIRIFCIKMISGKKNNVNTNGAKLNFEFIALILICSLWYVKVLAEQQNFKKIIFFYQNFYLASLKDYASSNNCVYY